MGDGAGAWHGWMAVRIDGAGANWLVHPGARADYLCAAELAVRNMEHLLELQPVSNVCL